MGRPTTSLSLPYVISSAGEAEPKRLFLRTAGDGLSFAEVERRSRTASWTNREKPDDAQSAGHLEATLS